ncbi:type II secretion system F family protein [Cypionkella sp.]|uniref:type II secretion system F family protein n=1 Tax=Cypionkella sp. TaxID=2811411 RepID=UPI003750593C
MNPFAAISEFLTAQFGELGPMAGLLAVALVLIASSLPFLLKKQPEPFDKIKSMREAEDSLTAAPERAKLRAKTKVDKLEKFASFLEPQNAEEMSAARLKMLRAGYKNKDAVRTFHFAQMTLGLGFLLFGILYTFVGNGDVEPSTQSMVLTTLLPGAAGYYLPMYWISKRAQERMAEIVAGFPDALDLMLVCVEAGQSLDQSINRIAKESRAGYPALADEFDMVSQEVKAGKERARVLKDMAERVNIPDISSFVTTLVQSATFGTSMSEALRVYSSEMRDKRIMRAEELANKLPTKLTLGTMLFTLPPLLLILIGPAISGIATTLGAGGF